MALKLHLGCGKVILPDFVNIDIRADIDSRIVKENIFTLDSIKDNSVDLIYACHLLEHIDRHKILSVLSCWYRKLKYGGVLRLSVPDLDTIMKLYVDKQYPLEDLLGAIYGGRICRIDEYIVNEPSINIFDSLYKWHSNGGVLDDHKTGFNKETLIELLRTAGFNKFNLWDWRTAEHSKYDDFSQSYLPHMDKKNGTLISLNIEATKRGKVNNAYEIEISNWEV